ncbi:MAG: hypothetical protein AAF676_14570 [Pseudomonadota bacterium]
MTNQVDDVAIAFADVIAAGVQAELVDETGAASAVRAPLAQGGDAALAFNEALDGWVLRLELAPSHIAEDQLPRYYTWLVELGGLTHFRTPQIAGLTADGRVSISTLLPENADATTIARFLTLSLAELIPPGSADPAEGAEPPPPPRRMMIYG